RRITLDVTPAAREWLALEGVDPAYGARPLRRLVQREIGDRLARLLLAGDVSDGAAVGVDRGQGGGLALGRPARPAWRPSRPHRPWGRPPGPVSVERRTPDYASRPMCAARAAAILGHRGRDAEM